MRNEIGVSLCNGFIQFASHEVIDQMTGVNIGGRPVRYIFGSVGFKLGFELELGL